MMFDRDAIQLICHVFIKLLLKYFHLSFVTKWNLIKSVGKVHLNPLCSKDWYCILLVVWRYVEVARNFVNHNFALNFAAFSSS